MAVGPRLQAGGVPRGGARRPGVPSELTVSSNATLPISFLTFEGSTLRGRGGGGPGCAGGTRVAVPRAPWRARAAHLMAPVCFKWVATPSIATVAAVAPTANPIPAFHASSGPEPLRLPPRVDGWRARRLRQRARGGSRAARGGARDRKSGAAGGGPGGGERAGEGESGVPRTPVSTADHPPAPREWGDAPRALPPARPPAVRGRALPPRPPTGTRDARFNRALERGGEGTGRGAAAAGAGARRAQAPMRSWARGQAERTASFMAMMKQPRYPMA